MVAWSLTSSTFLMYLSFVETVSKKKQKKNKTRCLDRNKKCDFRLKFDPNHIWRLFEKRLLSDFSLRCLKSHFKLSPLNRTTHKQLHPTLDGGSGGMSSFLSDPGSCFNAKSRKSTSSLLLLHRPRTSVWHKSPPEDDFCSRIITGHHLSSCYRHLWASCEETQGFKCRGTNVQAVCSCLQV